MLGFSNKTLNGTRSTLLIFAGNWYEDRLVTKQVYQEFPEKRIVTFIKFTLFSAEQKKPTSAVCLPKEYLLLSKPITADPNNRPRALFPTTASEN
jgi:hypothetical protein